jgi:hypothetical protein
MTSPGRTQMTISFRWDDYAIIVYGWYRPATDKVLEDFEVDSIAIYDGYYRHWADANWAYATLHDLAAEWDKTIIIEARKQYAKKGRKK